MKNDNNRLLRKIFYDSFLVLALTELANAITCVIDGIMVGRFLGSDAMAAYGIAAPYFSMAAIISGILMVSAQTMCSKAMSRGDNKKANSIYSTIIFFSMAVAIITMILCSIFSGSIARLLGARGDSSNLFDLTKDYWLSLQLCNPFMISLAVMMPILQLDGDNKRVRYSSFVVGIVDVLFDFLNVYIFKLGLFGMGLATAVSYLAGFLVALGHFRKENSLFHFDFKSIDFGITKAVLKEGTPRGIMRLCEGLGPVVTNILILSFAGSFGMSALAIQRNLSFLVGTIGWGISGSVLLCCGIYYAQGDRESIKDFQRHTLVSNYIIDGIIAVLIWVFAPQIVSIYNPVVNEVTYLAIDAVKCHSIRIIFMTTNYIFANYFQVIEKTKYSYFINIASGFVYLDITAGILGNVWGIDGFWISFPLSEALITLSFAIILILNGRKSKLKPMDKYMMLPDDFGSKEEYNINFSLRNIGDIRCLSSSIQEFCLLKGVDAKNSYRASLCVEEICNLIFENAFIEKKNTIDVKLTVNPDKDELLIYIRDDCKDFSLKDKMEKIKEDPNDPAKNIGIRIVQSYAKEISYSSALSINNMLITI